MEYSPLEQPTEQELHEYADEANDVQTVSLLATSSFATSSPTASFLELSRAEQRSAIEALLFASEEPLTLQALFDLLLQPLLPEPPKPDTTKNGAKDAGKGSEKNGKIAANGIYTNGTGSTNDSISATQSSQPVAQQDGTEPPFDTAFDDANVEIMRLNVEPPEGLAEEPSSPENGSSKPHSPETSIEATASTDNGNSLFTHEQGLIMLRELIEELNADFEATNRAFRIVPVAAAQNTSQGNAQSGAQSNAQSGTLQAAPMGYQFATTPKHGELLAQLVKSKSKKRLSQAALETLSIVAYRQPVSKPELEVIRGVNSGEIINKLLEKNLVTIIGRAETVGKPLLYGTTDEFLRLFGLASIEGLPKPRELEELMENRADIIEAIQSAKEAAASVASGTKNTLTDTMPEKTMSEIASHAAPSQDSLHALDNVSGNLVNSLANHSETKLETNLDGEPV